MKASEPKTTGAAAMSDEERARKLVTSHWIHGELMTEEVTLIAQAFASVRADAARIERERCATVAECCNVEHERRCCDCVDAGEWCARTAIAAAIRKDPTDD